MTDREPGRSEGLSESEVSALLGSLGDPEPLPWDVRGRLDDTLAALVRERQGEEAGASEEAAADEPAIVVPLRRRRVARGLLVAAAVLGVVGVGAAVTEDLLGDLSGGDAESATAGDAASESEAGGESAPERSRATEGEADSGADSDPGRTTTDSLTEPPRDATALRALRDVTTAQQLRSAVRAVARQEVAAGELDAPAEQQLRSGNAAKAARCAVPRVEGRASTVLFEGEPATLVVRRDGDVAEGRVYSCSLGLLLDGTRVRWGTAAE